MHYLDLGQGEKAWYLRQCCIQPIREFPDIPGSTLQYSVHALFMDWTIPCADRSPSGSREAQKEAAMSRSIYNLHKRFPQPLPSAPAEPDLDCLAATTHCPRPRGDKPGAECGRHVPSRCGALISQRCASPTLCSHQSTVSLSGDMACNCAWVRSRDARLAGFPHLRRGGFKKNSENFLEFAKRLLLFKAQQSYPTSASLEFSMLQSDDLPPEVAAESRAYIIYHTAIAVAIIVAVVISLRFLARWRTQAPFAKDDYTILWSLVPLTAMLVLSCTGMENTFSKTFDCWVLTMLNFSCFQRWSWQTCLDPHSTRMACISQGTHTPTLGQVDLSKN